MTIKSDILAVLRKQVPARVPWNIHGSLLRQGSLERAWRNAGLGIVDKSHSAYVTVTPHVSTEERQAWEGSRVFYTAQHTPVGTLHSKKTRGPDGSLWTVEYPVKTEDDLHILEFIVEDTAYYPNDGAIAAAISTLGEDGIVLCRMPRSPLQRLFIEWMGIEGVCIALAEFPEALDRLLARMALADEEPLRITAQSPCEAAWGPENITGPVTSPRLFARYCQPYYDRCASVLRQQGKPYGVHMDGQLAVLKDAIAQTGLDFVEGFTPPPMGNLGLPEAQAAWREKVIWANFPGSVFHQPDEAVIEYTVDLLQTGMAGGHFMLTFSEDLPDMTRGVSLVLEGVERYERRNPGCSRQ